MDERTEAVQSEKAPADVELADLELSPDDADRVKGGSEPVNDRKSPYA